MSSLCLRRIYDAVKLKHFPSTFFPSLPALTCQKDKYLWYTLSQLHIDLMTLLPRDWKISARGTLSYKIKVLSLGVPYCSRLFFGLGKQALHPIKHKNGINPLTLQLPDQICNSPYCQTYNSYNVSSENLILDQLIIPKFIFFFILITYLVDIVLIL